MRLPPFAAALAGIVFSLTSACGSPVPQGARVVAELDGSKVTVAEVQDYLAANLLDTGSAAMAGPDAVTQDPDERDAVKSRLFDDFIDERVLLLEAQRRGIRVGDDEVEAYLRGNVAEGEPAPADPKRRETAVRALSVQKLRERWVRDRVSVTPDEVDAYLSERRDAVLPGRRLTLRSLRLTTQIEARRTRARIQRRETSFERAAEAAGGQGASLEVELANLPPPVRDAVTDLAAGEVSAPVTVQGWVYLFRVDAWLDGVRPDEPTQRRRATDALLRTKYEEASRQLIQEVKRGLRVRIDVASLPFRYVPELSP